MSLATVRWGRPSQAQTGVVVVPGGLSLRWPSVILCPVVGLGFPFWTHDHVSDTLSGWQEELEMIFKQIDSNGDGIITFPELREVRAQSNGKGTMPSLALHRPRRGWTIPYALMPLCPYTLIPLCPYATWH